MNYGAIKKTDIANGEGVRVSLFVSGCNNHCKGCFNKETWDFNYGSLFTEQTENELLTALKPEYIAGLTILGGEPFEVQNQVALLPFLEKVKSQFPNKNIWCYTGYILESDIISQVGKVHTENTLRLLKLIDILVDGPFIQEQKDISLRFRGSKNQRIINLKEFFQTTNLLEK